MVNQKGQRCISLQLAFSDIRETEYGKTRITFLRNVLTAVQCFEQPRIKVFENLFEPLTAYGELYAYWFMGLLPCFFLSIRRASVIRSSVSNLSSTIFRLLFSHRIYFRVL